MAIVFTESLVFVLRPLLTGNSRMALVQEKRLDGLANGRRSGKLPTGRNQGACAAVQSSTLLFPFFHPSPMASTPASDADDLYARFRNDINTTASELETWLTPDESKSIGQDSGDGQSIGHHSGEHIVRIRRKKKADLTPDDEVHLHQVHS